VTRLRTMPRSFLELGLAGEHRSKPPRDGLLEMMQVRIRTGNGREDRPPIELGELHQGHGTTWNSRPTNRPWVRVPSPSARTTSPGEPGTA
jgi:hypothetical protein